MRSRLCYLGLTLLLASCGDRHQLQPPDMLPLGRLADPTVDPAGTFRFFIGGDSALLGDTTKAVKAGLLVIRPLAQPFDSIELYRAYPTVDNLGLPPDSGRPVWPPEACFVFDSSRHKGAGYAGIYRTGYMNVGISTPDHVLNFMLYRSPDAFYTVEAARTASGMIGVGRSSGFGFEGRNGAPYWKSEYFVAKRVGAPDWALCPAL